MPLPLTQQYIDIAVSIIMMGAGLTVIAAAIYLVIRKPT